MATLFLALVLTLVHFSGKAQIPNTNWWVPNDEVFTTVSDDTYTYIGGSFTYVGAFTSNATIVNNTSGTVVAGMPEVNGEVYVIVPDGHGGWYKGGNFWITWVA